MYTASTVAQAVARPGPSEYSGVELRVWERHRCGLSTTCQPIAARGSNELAWAAKVRDLSVGGMGLVLSRRFEPGTGLAIEVPPTETYPADTLLVRVVHAIRQPEGQWLLSCSFVSPLSDDELQRLLELGQLHPSQSGRSPPQATHHIVSEVVWEGPGPFPDGVWERGVGNGLCTRKLYRRLNLTGSWPISPGTNLIIWDGLSPLQRTHVVVNRCFHKENRWIVQYSHPQ